MQTLKAIIFDVDGTLANTEETHRQSFNKAFEEFNLNFNWSESDYAGLLSISGGRERLYCFLKNNRDNIRGDINLRDYTRKMHQRKSEIYREKLVAGHIGLRTGVLRLITEARQRGIKLAIATSSSMVNVETLLKNNLGEDALSDFEVIVTSDVVQDKKPSPAAYQFALAELGLEPEHCIAIEDTTNGNRAALAAGVKTVITTHEFTVDNDFEGASLIVDQLGEPDIPYRAISGQIDNYRYVDVDLLEAILSDAAIKNNEGWSEQGVSMAK